MGKNKLGYNLLCKTGILLVLLAVVFCFILTSGALKNTVMLAGDTLWHCSNEAHLLKSILDGNGLFSCFNKGLGIPLLNFYQPLFYLAVVFLHIVVFKSVSLFFIHNMLVCLLFSVFPLSVFYMARSFKFPSFYAGVISLFSVFPVSGWGNTLDAYFWIGLHTQVIGAFFLPITLGALNRLISPLNHKKHIFIFAISLSALFLGHAVYAVITVYLIIIYMPLFLIWRGKRPFITLTKRMFLGLFIAFCLVSFWIIPFIKFNSEYKFIPESERSFTKLAVSVTAKTFITAFIKGEILDNASPSSELFGGGEEGLRWSMNSDFKRFGIFTIFTILGLFFSIWKPRRFREIFFAILFLCGVLLFLGKDDIPLLRFLPYARNFQPVRAIFIIELASAFLSGTAFCRLFLIINDNLRIKHKYAVYLPFILFIILTPLLYERYKIATIIVKSENDAKFDELDKFYKGLTQIDNQPARLYYGRATGAADLSLRSLADCHFLNNAAGHDNEMAGSLSWLINEVQDKIPYSKNIMDLFYIRYLITQPQWRQAEISEKKFPVDLKAIASGGFFDLYKIENRTAFFAQPHKKPVLVWCDNQTWFYLNRLWLDLFTKHGDDIAPMVKMPRDSASLIRSKLFSAVLLIGFPLNNKTKQKYETAFSGFIDKQGEIFSDKPIWNLNINKLNPRENKKIIDILKKAKESDKDFSISSKIINFNKYSVNIESDKPRIIVAKTAYYKNWKIKSGAKESGTLWISPGFNAFLIPANLNSFIFEYVPSSDYIILFFSGFLFISVILILVKKGFCFFSDKKHICIYHFHGARYCFKFFRLIALLLSAYILAVSCRQCFFNKTSLIYPNYNQKGINPFEVVFRWNKLNENELYSFQLSENPRTFNNPVFHVDNFKETSIGYRGLKPYQTYYWRVMAKPYGKDKTSWSNTFKFHTGPYFPVSIE